MIRVLRKRIDTKTKITLIKNKVRLITVANIAIDFNSKENIRINRKIAKLEKRKGKKDNWLDTSIDKLVRLQTRWCPGHSNERGTLKRETESLLIAAQNNAKRT